MSDMSHGTRRVAGIAIIGIGVLAAWWWTLERLNTKVRRQQAVTVAHPAVPVGVVSVTNLATSKHEVSAPVQEDLAAPATVTGADRHAELKKKIRAELSRVGRSKWPNILRLLDEDPTLVNERYDSWTLLHRAVFEGSVDAVAGLLARGADVKAREEDAAFTRRTPLHMAYNAKIAELLLDHGADLNARDDLGWTPLFDLSHYDKSAAALLLARGADVNACDLEGRTALFNAVELFSVSDDDVDWLLANGAAVDARDAAGRTALLAACLMENHELVMAGIERLLAAGADVNAMDRTGRTPLMALLQSGGQLNDRAAQLLLQYGADTSGVTGNGYTVLHALAAGGHNEMLAYYLKNGVTPNIGTTAGLTPLMEAVAGGKADTLELLLEYGAVCEPDAIYPSGESLMMAAVKSGNRDVVSRLISLGANVNGRDSDGNTALDYTIAAGQDRMFALLIEQGADVSDANALIAVADSAGTNGVPLLILAIADESMVDYLLKHGARVNVRAKDSRTPLMEAVNRGLLKVVALLLAHGADVNARGDDGATPLDRARAKGYTEIAALLIRHGAVSGSP